MKQQNNINNVTKDTLIGIFGTILDNRQSIKESFKKEHKVAHYANINYYHKRKEETDEKLRACYISKNSADHLKNILAEEDNKSAWKEKNKIDPELDKLRNTISKQEQDIDRKIVFLKNMKLNWDGKNELIEEYKKLQDRDDEATDMFNNVIDYMDSTDSSREKVDNPLYKEYVTARTLFKKSKIF
ncbi:MAG: hypothetical protein GY820_25505 [Gammaproteobacteria bacterium]|nr:hypothetical protein [Gammaproteobacteria bacterium]